MSMYNLWTFIWTLLFVMTSDYKSWPRVEDKFLSHHTNNVIAHSLFIIFCLLLRSLSVLIELKTKTDTSIRWVTSIGLLSVASLPSKACIPISRTVPFFILSTRFSSFKEMNASLCLSLVFRD